MKKYFALLITALLLAAAPVSTPPAAAAAPSYYVEVPAGTRFLIELRTKLEAKKVKPGKKFTARTLEAVRATDGTYIPPGAKLKGRVAHAEKRGITLRFEKIKAGRDYVPVIATVVGVLGEKKVKSRTDREGEIERKGGRGKNTAIGALIGGGAGAAVGAATAGGVKGTRLELELDRSLAFRPK